MSPKFKGNYSPRGNRKEVRIVIGGLKHDPVTERSRSVTPSKVAVYSHLSHLTDFVKIPDGQYHVKVKAVPSGRQNVQDISEGEVVYAIELTEKIQRTLRDIRADGRKMIRISGGNGGGGGGGTTTSRIFHRLVDADKLADSIIDVMRYFFQGEKECKICNVVFNLYDFFLLVQFYFIFIHILESDKQRPFCEYLKDKVFGGKDKVGLRNFNIYANKDAYTNFAELLKNDKIKENLRFGSRPTLPREKTENYLLAPFQEIGWKFQHSDYFDDLREEIEKVNKFIV